MQITLNENEIKRAIIDFVGNQGISITGSHVDVTLTAGRGPNGMSATIDISNDPAPPKNTVVNASTGTVNEAVSIKEPAELTFNQAGEPKVEPAAEEPPFDTAAAESKPLFSRS